MPSVIIIGAGIGGLCLAQGLIRAGVDVDVYERDPSPAIRHQGYRVGIKAAGATALRACLPAHLVELAVATSTPTVTGLFAFYDTQLRQTFAKPLPRPDDPDNHFGVNRRTFREILTTGVPVHFGRSFQRYEHRPAGVRAHFADGTHVDADLLVGADGAGSRVRAQLLPDAYVDELGRSVYGRTPLTPELRAAMPDPFINGFSRVMGSGGTGMGIGPFRAREPIAAAVARLAPEARLTPVDDYLMWTVPLADGVEDLDDYVRRTTADWHPTLRTLVAEANAAETFAVTLHSARPVESWDDPHITLLGDAIHAMSPGRGEGANIALRDAETLCRTLIERRPIAEYQSAMLDYGFAAVNASRESPFGPKRGQRSARVDDAAAPDRAIVRQSPRG
jgi:2-polyprenyl-6-methoxyphenol hydroxylase-like FAD-dependent oxidoreductase